MAHRVDVDELAAAQDDLLHRACVLHHSERGDVQRVHDGLRISCILRGDSTLAEGVAKVGRGCAQTRAGGGSWRWAVGPRGSHLRAPGRLSPSSVGAAARPRRICICRVKSISADAFSRSFRNEMEMQNIGISTMRYLILSYIRL